MHHNSTSTYKKRRTAPSHLSVYLASLSFGPKAWKTCLASQNSKTKSDALSNCLGPQLSQCRLTSGDAEVQPGLSNQGFTKMVSGCLSMEYSKSISKRECQMSQKINGSCTCTTFWSFPDKHDKIFPLTGCHYIHSFCPVCTNVLCRPKAKDEMQLLKRVFCLSHQKASLDNVVVFMWLCKVVIKFRTFEEDHPANTILGMDVQPNVSNHQKCPTEMMANGEV